MTRRRGSRSSRKKTEHDEFRAGIDCPEKPRELTGYALIEQMRQTEAEVAKREAERRERKAAKKRQNQQAVASKRRERLAARRAERHPMPDRPWAKPLTREEREQRGIQRLKRLEELARIEDEVFHQSLFGTGEGHRGGKIHEGCDQPVIIDLDAGRRD